MATHEELAFHYQDWIEHTQMVRMALLQMIQRLQERIITHDMSKLADPERDIYAEVIPEFAKHAFGTEGHKATGRKLGPAWEHHVRHNVHHPEHFQSGIEGMTLLDLLEMLCDWKAAGSRYGNNGDIHASIETLKEKHGIQGQLAEILHNTAQLLEAPLVVPWSQITTRHEDEVP